MLTAVKRAFYNIDDKPLSLIEPAKARKRAEIYKKDVRDKGYKFSLIALCAGVARADGEINRQERQAFNNRIDFKIEGEDIDSLFARASIDSALAEHYAFMIANFYPEDRKRYKEIIDLLLYIATIDGALNTEEIILLSKVVGAFGMSDKYFISRLKGYMIPRERNPFRILNVARNVKYNDLRKAYRNAILAYHPDKLLKLDDSRELLATRIIELANDRTAIINRAYKDVKRVRRFR